MCQAASLAAHYGTTNKSKVLRKLIDDAYESQIINQQNQTQKEDN